MFLYTTTSSARTVYLHKMFPKSFALLVIAAILVLTFIPPNADASVTKGDVARVTTVTGVTVTDLAAAVVLRVQFISADGLARLKDTEDMGNKDDSQNHNLT
ncbi:hypothetical protein Fcan01_27957 [Folsomia candida]|uniref:Uncharacterized protein n=1 Tax=Folsomia candida TaxID=158441 RepID=A0A226CV43_FOLCA|nr:hypothetical protein Fcan01_27957 [Folsomia candida]